MKTLKSLLLAFMLLATASATWADRGHFHHGPQVGVGIGLGAYVNPFPIFYGRYYYGKPYYGYAYPYRYCPDVVVAPTIAPTVVYVEQAPADNTAIRTDVPPGVSPSSSSGRDWYYCHNPDGFYPAIKACPSGWQRVPATR